MDAGKQLSTIKMRMNCLNCTMDYKKSHPFMILRQGSIDKQTMIKCMRKRTKKNQRSTEAKVEK